jgi:hypothetical protein
VTIQAGFGTALITPPTPVALAGFGAPQLATEVHDELEARAVLLKSPQGTVCLVVCDLLGMSPEFANPARAAVAAALSLDLPAVLIASTHTHSGPSAMAGTSVLGWPTPEGYGETLAEGCASAARAALGSLRDAELRYGRWSLPDGLSINRRGYPYDPWFSAMDVMAPDTPERLGASERLGTIANLAIHPVSLGPECLAVSADWVGHFRRALESRAGGTTTLLSGALGDVNPIHVHRQDNSCEHDGFAEAEELGTEVAQAVDAVLASTESLPGAGAQVVASRELEVPVGDTQLARLISNPTTRVELVEWQLGPIRLVSLPGEAFQAFGRQVSEARGDRVLLAGLSPLWQGYLPHPFVEGGYEETISYGREAVDAILAALLEVPGPPA